MAITKLKVKTTAALNTAIFENSGQTYSYTAIKVNEALNNKACLTFVVGDALASTDIIGEISGLITSNGGVLQGAMTFKTNAADSLSERMRILANGNVGIGTTAPGASKLDVRLNDSYGAYGTNQGLSVTNETTTGDAGFVMLKARYNNTSPAQEFYQVGGMGGGKETALANNEWGGFLSFFTTSDGTAGAASGMFEHMRITADGNVGIGNTAPVEKLQVSGNIFAQTNIIDADASNANPNLLTQACIKMSLESDIYVNASRERARQ